MCTFSNREDGIPSGPVAEFEESSLIESMMPDSVMVISIRNNSYPDSTKNNTIVWKRGCKLLLYYYRFIVRFPIGLDFLFITFTILLHLLLSWTSSLSISSLAISTSTLSNHVFLGLPTGLLPSTLYSIHFFTQSSSPIDSPTITL